VCSQGQLTNYTFGAGYAPLARKAGVYDEFKCKGQKVQTRVGPVQVMSM